MGRRSKKTMLWAMLGLAGACSGLPVLADTVPGSRTIEASVREWPRWRGTGFDGVAHDGAFSRPFRLEVRWRRQLGSGYSGVVVAEGHAVTMFSDGRQDFLVALDAEHGAEHWRLPIADTFPGREGATDGPVSTPAIDGGVVFALGPRGDLLAVDLRSGESLWKTRLIDRLGASTPHWGFTTSPLVAGELVIVETGGSDGRMVTAFDRHSGEPVWFAGADEVHYQSPILARVAGREQLIVSGATSLAGLDPVTGRELWRHLHDGDRFYRKIINPVVVGADRLLLTHRSQESQLIRLIAEAEGFRVEEEWTTPHLKLNYATPVVEDGHIFGYSGSFLSSVDARTGELAWKSRPPGNGWPIVVDGHLVVLTKRGTLHVAEATPEGFHEKAALEVFPKLVWTPPSFAYGRIYGRDSYLEVVCIDVVATAAEEPSAAEPEGAIPGKIPGTRFARWVEQLEAAPDKDRRIQQWRLEHESLPVIEDDRWAHIVYVGEADDLVLHHSGMHYGEDVVMHRVEGTDFHYASLELEPDARIGYRFVRDLEKITDPANPRRFASLVFSGEMSQLLMPRAQLPSDLAETEPRGRIETFDLETEAVRVGAKTWGGTRKVHVYLPPGYEDEGDRRYPALYVLYGAQMLRQAELDRLLDSMIGSRITPLIAVFVESISPYEYARSQRQVHGQMLVEQVIPRIDQRYRTIAGAAHRTVAGVDEAGYAALELAFRYPRVVGMVTAQSPLPIGKGDEELLRRIANASETPTTVYLDWGRYDLRNPADGTDVPAYGRRLRAALEARGVDVAGREWNDGSDVELWSWRFEHMLESFFPILW